MDGYRKCVRTMNYLERWCGLLEKASGTTSAAEMDSNNVEELDKHRPRLYVTVDGKTTEYPIRTIIGWASGAYPLPEEKVLRFIIMEWIANIAGIKLGPADYE